jgi:ParB/RepB/Spo0J family partition protein
MIELRTLAVDHIHASPNNPRRTFNDATLAELATSIREQGVLQPILVRPLPIDRGPRGMPLSEKLDHFEIIAGHRRLRASVLAGLAEIPAVIRELDDIQSLEAAILENLQREDVHPLEEAEGYERLMKSGNYSLEHLMERIGKSRSYVYARLKLLALVPVAREAFYAGKLTPSTALLVARIPTEQQARAVKELTEGYDREPLSFRAAVRHVESSFMLELAKASFKTDDASYGAGPCTTCPKRTGNQPELFADIKSGDLCTDSACFNNKREVNYLRLKAIAEERGAKVIEGEAAQNIAPHGAGHLESKQFVSLQQHCYEAPKIPTYETLLGKDFQPDTYIKDPRTGELVPIVAKATIAEHLAAKGIALPSSRNEKEKDNERKAKAETAYREALLKAISARYAEQEPMEMSERELRLIADFMIERIGHDGRTRLSKLFGERDVKSLLTTTDLAIFLIQCAMIGQTHVPGYSTMISKPEKLIALAKSLGLDPAVVKREVQKAAKPVKTIKATAKKPASTPSDAAPAADKSAKKTKAPRAAKPKAEAKPEGKASPAPATPGNEAATPPAPVASKGVKDDWPFPTEARI